MRGIRYSHAGCRRIEVKNILEHIHCDLFGNIHAQTMSSNQVAAVRRQRREHILSIFRRHISQSAQTAMILKLIPVSKALLRNGVQYHFIEFQTVIIVLTFIIPLFVDDTEDLGAVLLTKLPDCR